MRVFRTIGVIICCLCLTSCSGLKNIQDLTYIVAIGMDYDEDKKQYKVFIQGLNFANVAKQEGSRPVEPIPIYVASATGETLNLAVSKLYKKSEPPLFFGHVVTLVLSENVVKQKFNEVIKEVGRNRSLRPTLRVVIAKDNMEDILNTKALFNYPAVYTVLFKGKANEISQDEIRPIILMNFLRDYYEPMGAAKIPIVTIDHDAWKADKDFPILYFNGYALFQHEKYMTDFSFNDAFLTNWLLEKKVTYDHKVEKDGELIAAVRLSSPKMKFKYEKDTSTPKFSIELSVQGDLLEKIKDIPAKELQEILEKDLKEKVISLYKTGLTNKIDILNAGEDWYRQHPKKYQELTKHKNFYLDENSLTNIKMDVTIVHYNSYKYSDKE
ncbi:Ger(x)C family spore germination protein [Bacillus sp. BGMRC 2118]|nr:Ger(x)C family spore germination protein [Bacillus sp. BGMRC 2118]